VRRGALAVGAAILSATLVPQPAPRAQSLFSFSYFDVPNTGTLGVGQISDTDTIAGYYNTYRGFIRDKFGTIVDVVHPQDVYGVTVVNGINAAGAATGEFWNAVDASAPPHWSGFIDRDGWFNTYDVPNRPRGSHTGIFGINDAGDFCGNSSSADLSITRAFVAVRGSDVALFSVPLASGLPSPYTACFAVNNLGDAAGDFRDVDGVFHGYVRAGDGTLAIVDVPGAATDASKTAAGTALLGLTDSGWMSGHYWDAAHAEHGYLASPDGAFYSIDVPGALVTSGGGLNARGQVVGYFVDRNGVYRGYIATPNGFGP
jgi:hypothetical protein